VTNIERIMHLYCKSQAAASRYAESLGLGKVLRYVCDRMYFWIEEPSYRYMYDEAGTVHGSNSVFNAALKQILEAECKELVWERILRLQHVAETISDVQYLVGYCKAIGDYVYTVGDTITIIVNGAVCKFDGMRTGDKKVNEFLFRETNCD